MVLLSVLAAYLTHKPIDPTPVSRPEEVFVADVQEWRKLHYVTFVGTGSGSSEKTTHGLKVFLGLADHYFDGTGYTDHEVVVSIKKDKWGSPTENGSTLTVGNGFDSGAGSPPSGSSGDWMHISAPLRVPNQVVKLPLAYFSDDEGESALEGDLAETIVYRETATDSSSVQHTVVYLLTYGILKKMATGDCPIDTRKTFNASNEANVVDWFADANTALRNLNFDPYIFRGGLFIGNMPWQLRDRSGTARLQLWFDDFDLTAYEEEPPLQFATTVIWDNGTIPAENFSVSEWDDAFDLHYYYGSTGTSESTTTWANKWDGSIPSSPPNGLYTAAIPAWTSTAQAEYVNMPLTDAEPASATTNSSILKWIFAKCKLESTFISAHTVRWRYFLSKEGAGEGDPADKAPRCWGIFGVSFLRVP